jgi:hypothetical protein
VLFGGDGFLLRNKPILWDFLIVKEQWPACAAAKLTGVLRQLVLRLSKKMK